MNDETRTRFLADIARRLPADRVIEIHLFAAMRQGGREGGVAVIALDRESASSLEVDASPYADEPSAQRVVEEIDPPATPAPESRYTIYSARYRHTLKGLDRGKWEVSVTEEADAPLLTVDAVVRGVQRRSGEADEVLRLSGEEFRAALPAVQIVS